MMNVWMKILRNIVTFLDLSLQFASRCCYSDLRLLRTVFCWLSVQVRLLKLLVVISIVSSTTVVVLVVIGIFVAMVEVSITTSIVVGMVVTIFVEMVIFVVVFLEIEVV